MRPPGSFWEQGLKELAASLRPGSKVLEVGSYAGESAEIFLSSGNVSLLVAVDAWMDRLDMFDVHTRAAPMESVELEFDIRMSKFPGMVRKIKDDSRRASETLPDGAFNLVYIDSQHTEEHLLEELRLYMPKVAPGGFIGGHDYGNASYPGVKAAIERMLGTPDKVFRDTSWIKRRA